MSPTFTAIDFETAQGYRWSICQVGLVRVEDGDIVAKLDLLVKPPYNYYWRNFTAMGESLMTRCPLKHDV